MHTWHEGLGRDLCASLMVAFVEDGLLEGASGDECLASLHTHMKAWCSACGVICPARPFTMVSLGRQPPSRKKYPVLGANYKAAHVKIFTAFVAHFAYQTCTGTELSKLRVVCAWGAADFLHVLDTEPLIMSHEAVARAAYALQVFLLAYQKLANIYLQRRESLFKVRPKAHYLGHLGRTMERTRLNPRKMSCFADEDIVGRIAKMTRSTNRRNCSKRSLQRCLLFLGTRWRQRQMHAALSMGKGGSLVVSRADVLV